MALQGARLGMVLHVTHAGLHRPPSGGEGGGKLSLIKVQIIPENLFPKLSAGRAGVRMS